MGRHHLSFVSKPGDLKLGEEEVTKEENTGPLILQSLTPGALPVPELPPA